MRSPMVKVGIIAGVMALLTIVAIIYSAMTSYSVSCEVCITFNGRTVCREAFGPEPKEAIRTATDNACALLTSGMTNSIRCGKTPPTSVACSTD